MKKINKGIVTLTERGPLTAKERKSLMKLEKLPDSAIDLSDIPEIKTSTRLCFRKILSPQRKPA